MIYVFVLSLFQTVTFSLASRARNRDHHWYNFIASIIGNLAWFLCFRELDISGYDWTLLIPYSLGGGLGAVLGTRLSMVIEKRIHASADKHLEIV